MKSSCYESDTISKKTKNELNGKPQKSNELFTYQLEKQKTEINQEYYAELERQYDLSNILIHDIKKHLGVVRTYLSENETDKAILYIDSVYESNEIQTLKQFSKNKLINEHVYVIYIINITKS